MSVSTDTERIFRIGGYVKRAKLNLRNEREIRAFHRNAIERRFGDFEDGTLVDVYIDITGYKETAKRPEMLRLMRDCADGKVNLIFAETKGYLSANTREFCYWLHFIFNLKERVDIITDDDQFNINTILNADKQREAPVMASIRHYDFADAAKDTPFYKEIIPAMLDYFETEHYVFTHGWIPSIPNRDKSYSYISSWREADREQWNQARWFNGMDAAQTADENKTIVCGHWHTSYGHSKYEHKGTEFGEDADFSPYYGPGIIAIDACTAFSGKVNCLVIED